MPIYARKKNTTFTPAPEGLHPAVCVDVIDLGEQPTAWGPKEKIEIRWQLDEVNPETQRPFEVRSRFTNSLHEKAILRQTLETWRNKKFTAQELQGFDLEALIGVGCQIQIVHAPGDEGRVWANVQAVVPFPKGMVKLKPRDYVREVDRNPSQESTGTVEEDDEKVPF